KAAAVAWTVPLVIDGISNPAAAATCAKGTFWVAYQSALASTPAAAPCTPTAGYVNTTPAAVALTAAFTGAISPPGAGGSIAHIGSGDGNMQAVKLTIAGCSCVITRVMGVVHRRGPATTPTDCPAIPCQSAGSAPLLITGGAINTTTVTVAPNYVAAAVCSGAPGIHWGAPGTPNGKLLVEIRCG
ncbi:MAG: hypothetical protein WCC60_19375, partial [Ilumatobacteraceae bacterium]